MNILYCRNYKPPQYTFECDRCGTVFECAENEVQRILDHNDMYLSCVCPICDKLITKYECRCVGNTKAVDK